MFYLRKADGTLFYLLKNKEYNVGRKDCELLILNDQSISRKHAKFTVNDDKVVLCDCGSRYNTFIDGSKIDANKDITLKNEQVIKFGAFASIFTFHERKLVTTTSSIKSDQKASLKANLELLGASLIPNWNTSCTHVTVEEIMLTVKVLCAVIVGIPIVTLKYWDDYARSIAQNVKEPVAADYKPPCSEMILNYQDLCLDYKEERRRLFKNKIFVFPTGKEKDKMVDMIELAGGEAISMDATPVKKEAIANSTKEYLILQTSESGEKQKNASLVDIVRFITKRGQRTIPLQEIALSIVMCSCEKNCNPDFDKKGTVLAVKSQTQSESHSVGNVLAEATESQKLFVANTESIKLEKLEDSIIPQSVDLDLSAGFNSVEIKVTVKDNNSDNTREAEENRSIKREGDLILENASKKFKEETPPLTKNKRKKVQTTDATETKDEIEEKPPKKPLFAFRSANEDPIPGPSSMVVNPFAKKRKLVQNEDENVAKKSNSLSSFTSNTSSFLPPPPPPLEPAASTSSLRSKNPIKLSNVASVSQQTNKTSHKDIPSSTLIDNRNNLNSFDSEISRIEAVDSGLERSFGWCSRKSGTTRREVDCDGSMEEMDPEILKYIESFKNTVIIEEETLVTRKPSVINNNDESFVDSNAKNFKKFKKVQPLKEQTRILSSFVDIVCNDKTSHQVVEEDGEDSNEDDTDMGVPITNSRNRFGNRFRR